MCRNLNAQTNKGQHPLHQFLRSKKVRNKSVTSWCGQKSCRFPKSITTTNWQLPQWRNRLFDLTTHFKNGDRDVISPRKVHTQCATFASNSSIPVLMIYSAFRFSFIL